MNNEILSKVDEIIKSILDSDSYQKYLSLKKQIKKNKDLMKLINEVKVLQKDVTHKIAKKSELDEKMAILKSNPLYLEYCNTLDEINNVFNIVENSINKYFYEKLN